MGNMGPDLFEMNWVQSIVNQKQVPITKKTMAIGRAIFAKGGQ